MFLCCEVLLLSFEQKLIKEPKIPREDTTFQFSKSNAV